MCADLRQRLVGSWKQWLEGSLPRGDKAAVVIALASSKGGVGKTTSAINLATAWHERGLKILLLDLDPQAHVSASLRLPAHRGDHTVADCLLGKCRDLLEAVYHSTKVDLDIAGSEKYLAEIELQLSAKIGKELLLSGCMQLARSHYDIILIDCPPNTGTLTLNALCAADKILVPSDISVLALEGVTDILNTVEILRNRLQRSIELLGIMATRYDKRLSGLNQTILQSFADLYGDKLLKTYIPQSSAINRAHLEGSAVLDFESRSAGAQAYRCLAEEIAEILKIDLKPLVNDKLCSKASDHLEA